MLLKKKENVKEKNDSNLDLKKRKLEKQRTISF